MITLDYELEQDYGIRHLRIADVTTDGRLYSRRSQGKPLKH